MRPKTPLFLLSLPTLIKQEYSGRVLNNEEANTYLAEKIKEGQPMFVTRYGSAELVTIMSHFFIKDKKIESWEQVRHLQGILRYDIVFPTTNVTLERFAQLYIDASASIDALGIWYNYGEHILHSSYSPDAVLIPLESLEPFRFSDPWSAQLAGKKVLVIHPYEESIYKQYEIKDKLFRNNVLPDFDLKVYAPYNSLIHARPADKDWFDVLDHMMSEIRNIDFDIALVAAGPFGLPLGCEIKKMGRQAIHIGGALQLLFGIKGNRWEERPEFAQMMNEYWVKPLPEETPTANVSNGIDKASYW